MLPLPLLPSFSALYRCRLSAAFSAFRSGASARASGGTEVRLLRLPRSIRLPRCLSGPLLTK